MNNTTHKRLERRRSSGKKNRSFTPQSISKVLPPKLEESNENKPNGIVSKSNGIITNETKLKGTDKFDAVFVVRIEDWLKHHQLWFSAGDKGQKLLISLLESGIENPEELIDIISIS